MKEDQRATERPTQSPPPARRCRSAIMSSEGPLSAVLVSFWFFHALTTGFSDYYSEIADSRPHAAATGDSARPGPRRGHWGGWGIPLFAPRFSLLLGTFCWALGALSSSGS